MKKPQSGDSIGRMPLSTIHTKLDRFTRNVTDHEYIEEKACGIGVLKERQGNQVPSAFTPNLYSKRKQWKQRSGRKHPSSLAFHSHRRTSCTATHKQSKGGKPRAKGRCTEWEAVKLMDGTWGRVPVAAAIYTKTSLDFKCGAIRPSSGCLWKRGNSGIWRLSW